MSVVIDTPETIAFARLASVRACLKLESVGMKTRGGALRPRIADEMGLKPRDSYDTFIAEVEKRMDNIMASLLQ